MEPIQVKKIFTYQCLYPSGNEVLKDLLRDIPSASAIEKAAYLLVRKATLTIHENEHSLFFQMFPFMDKSLVLDLSSFISSINPNEYEFIDKVALHILIDNILANHNDSKDDVTESPEIFSKFIKAYLICCDMHLFITENSLRHISSEEEMCQLLICEALKYNDIFFKKDYRFEMLKLYHLLQFFENNSIYSEWLKLFLDERNLKRWDHYHHFLMTHYCSSMTNPDGATPTFLLESKTHYAYHLINAMTVIPSGYTSDIDFVGMRFKPIYHMGGLRYVIMSLNFFVDKFFQGFLFDFAKVLINHSQTTKITNYSQLKKLVGDEFIEKHFFYNIMYRCFQSYTCYNGSQLKSILTDSEPDFYMRKGNKIFLFEFKDILLDSTTKHSGDYNAIKRELYEQFVLSKFDKYSGKIKRHPQRKGVTQLLHTIENKLPIIITEVDRVDSTKGYLIYPIIVYTDRNLSIEGINNILSDAFDENQANCSIRDEYVLQPLTMIPLEELTLLEDYFTHNILILEDLIDLHNKYDKTVPFNKLMVRIAEQHGYQHKMSSRFREVLDKMKELDT